MSALDPRDADRFGKLLGLLGSNHDGERAAAALKATEFLRARELGWFDVGEMLKRPPVVIVRPEASAFCPHQVDARRCLASSILWKPHEAKFLRQISEQRRPPTEKQRAWLDGLVDRVARAEGPDCEF